MTNRRFALICLNVYGAATLLEVAIHAVEPLATIARVILIAGMVVFCAMALTAGDQ